MCDYCIYLNISIQYNFDFVYDFDFGYNFDIDIEICQVCKLGNLYVVGNITFNKYMCMIYYYLNYLIYLKYKFKF